MQLLTFVNVNIYLLNGCTGHRHFVALGLHHVPRWHAFMHRLIMSNEQSLHIVQIGAQLAAIRRQTYRTTTQLS